jgi:3-phosphoshikimate 1-carboxyvinyltransferase
MANRALVLASLAKGESRISGLPPDGLPDDVAAMFGALRALGAGMGFADGRLRVYGGARFAPAGALDVGAAGTALRFLLPLAALHCKGPVRFIGAKRLFERPLAPLLDALASCGASWCAGAAPQDHGSGGSGGGLLVPPTEGPSRVDLEIDGSLSSQFASGLAMAAAGLPGGGAIRWAGPAASWSYLALTRSLLEAFGCPARLSEGSFVVPGGALRPADVEVPGDWSAAAPFFCAAAVLGRRVEAFPLDPSDGQADRAVLDILDECGSSWAFSGGACVFDGRLGRGVQADLSDCPDLAPALTAVAAAAPGPSELRGLGGLPHKESDRLRGIARLVAWAGGRAEERPGPALVIRPAPKATAPLIAKASPPPAPFDPHGDHRMAFAAAVCALRNGGEVLDRVCVAKSFPGFWEEWRKWGP